MGISASRFADQVGRHLLAACSDIFQIIPNTQPESDNVNAACPNLRQIKYSGRASRKLHDVKKGATLGERLLD